MLLGGGFLRVGLVGFRCLLSGVCWCGVAVVFVGLCLLCCWLWCVVFYCCLC